MLSAAQILAYVLVAGTAVVPLRVDAATVCATPGNDDPAPSSGIVNDYWSVSASAASGSTSLTLGSRNSAGAGSSINTGDLLIVIQMQNATITTTNSSAYGSNGTTGSGQTSVGSTGKYEYVVAQGSVGATGGSLTIKSTGAGNGLKNSYTVAAASTTAGQSTVQVVRVPQYTTTPSGSSYTAVPWNGSSGGVLAVDVQNSVSNLTLNADGDGFRGGAGLQLAGAASGYANTDYRAAAPAATATPGADGSKGEGIAGTPKYLYGQNSSGAYVWSQNAASNTYPSGSTTDGSMARGAPGNAGGGGTDNAPTTNAQNTGGGGGSNAGAGGLGGINWSNGAAPTTTINAKGGAAETNSVSIVDMGGGGGAGSNNDGTGGTDSNGNFIGSSGAPGGGIIMIRTGGSSSGVSLSADGANGVGATTDGGGGGGAGGAIMVSGNATLSGVTATATGGTGGSANPSATPGALDTGGTYFTNEYGPGGGGGGGAILSSTAVTTTVTGGSSGTTTTSNLAYGATNGSNGTTATITITQIVGVASGAECAALTELQNGPSDTTEATYFGADETGSYDGSVNTSGDNDFTARAIPLASASPSPINSGTTDGTPVGNSLTLSSAATVDVPNVIYYNNTTGTIASITLSLPTLPTGWSAKFCADSGGGSTHVTTTPTSANCTYAGTGANCGTAKNWKSLGGTTATFCGQKNNTNVSVYWIRYTSPTSLTAFSRYDAISNATDGTRINQTHNELYAGFVAITKHMTVVSNNCSGTSAGSSGACPGGVVRYSIDYRNIMVGGGLGTEGQNTAAFVATSAGTLVLTDDGTQSTSSQTTTPNWATFSKGLAYGSPYGAAGMQANLGSGSCGIGSQSACTAATSCGVSSNACGDTTASTTFTYATGVPKGSYTSTFSTGVTAFQATIGGATFQLYPSGVTGKTWQGYLTFAVVVK